MSRFQFRLERVAAFRRTQADLEHARLEQLEAGLTALRQASRGLVGERERSAAAVARPGARTESWSAQSLDVYGQYAAARLQDLAAEEARQQVRIVQQQQRVLEAERKCELLAKLRERQHEVWRQNEAKQLEELASDVFLAAWSKRRS